MERVNIAWRRFIFRQPPSNYSHPESPGMDGGTLRIELPMALMRGPHESRMSRSPALPKYRVWVEPPRNDTIGVVPYLSLGTVLTIWNNATVQLWRPIFWAPHTRSSTRLTRESWIRRSFFGQPDQPTLRCRSFVYLPETNTWGRHISPTGSYSLEKLSAGQTILPRKAKKCKTIFLQWDESLFVFQGHVSVNISGRKVGERTTQVHSQVVHKAINYILYINSYIRGYSVYSSCLPYNKAR